MRGHGSDEERNGVLQYTVDTNQTGIHLTLTTTDRANTVSLNTSGLAQTYT